MKGLVLMMGTMMLLLLRLVALETTWLKEITLPLTSGLQPTRRQMPLTTRQARRCFLSLEYEHELRAGSTNLNTQSAYRKQNIRTA
jgi:hypothetical protein